MSDAAIWENARPVCPGCHQPIERTGEPGVGVCPSGFKVSFDEDHAKRTYKLRVTALGTYEYTADWKIQSLGEGHEEE